MKIDTFLASLPVKNTRFRERMKQITDVWSNKACIGYAIHSMNMAGLDEQMISEVVNNMAKGFDEISVSEAEKYFNEY